MAHSGYSPSLACALAETAVLEPDDGVALFLQRLLEVLAVGPGKGVRCMSPIVPQYPHLGGRYRPISRAVTRAPCAANFRHQTLTAFCNAVFLPFFCAYRYALQTLLNADARSYPDPDS